MQELRKPTTFSLPAGEILEIIEEDTDDRDVVMAKDGVAASASPRKSHSRSPSQSPHASPRVRDVISPREALIPVARDISLEVPTDPSPQVHSDEESPRVSESPLRSTPRTEEPPRRLHLNTDISLEAIDEYFPTSTPRDQESPHGDMFFSLTSPATASFLAPSPLREEDTASTGNSELSRSPSGSSVAEFSPAHTPRDTLGTPSSLTAEVDISPAVTPRESDESFVDVPHSTSSDDYESPREETSPRVEERKEMPTTTLNESGSENESVCDLLFLRVCL